MQGSPVKHSPRPVRFGWGLGVVVVALMCAIAQAVHVDAYPPIGAGPDSFQVALIADPGNKYDNLRAAKDTINKLIENHWGNIQMVTRFWSFLLRGVSCVASQCHMCRSSGIMT